MFLNCTFGFATAHVQALRARVSRSAASVFSAALPGSFRMRAPAANAAAVASVADVFAGPYRLWPVAADGGLADGSPTMLSTDPSVFCMRTRKSSPHFASSSTSGIPLPDSGML